MAGQSSQNIHIYMVKKEMEEKSMKLVFLEADNLGEDMKFDRFFELGEVVVYGQTPEELIPERIADADAILINKLPMN